MPPVSSTDPAASSALAQDADPIAAADSLIDSLQRSESMRGSPTLLVFFASGELAERADRIAQRLGERLSPHAMLGVSASGVVCDRAELQEGDAAAAFALHAPGVDILPFSSRDLPTTRAGAGDEEVASIADALRSGPSLRGVLWFADPFSAPMTTLLPAMSRAVDRSDTPHGAPPIIGGLASAADRPGLNRMILNDELFLTGGVGVAIHGDIRIDPLVSQGCRPIGEPMVITAAKRNILISLGGRRALDALNETVLSLDPDDRALLQKGVLIGRVVNEYKDRFGRGDFLIRNVIGADQGQGALAVGDILRTGQTVQFHVRDAASADEDLRMMLDVERFDDPPLGVLAALCSGRGTNLFVEPNHDAGAISDAFAAGERPTPLAGFFAAGEIGPVGGSSFLHGHTASLALIRRPGGRAR